MKSVACILPRVGNPCLSGVPPGILWTRYAHNVVQDPQTGTSEGRLAAGHSDMGFQPVAKCTPPRQQQRPSQPNMNLPQLLDNLNSRDASLREDAERRLRALAPDELMQFALLEQAHFKRWAKRAWIKIVGLLFPTELPILALFNLIFYLLGLGHRSEGQFLGPPMAMAFALLFCYFRITQMPRSRHALVNAVKELDDVRFVPILLTMEEGVGGGIKLRDAVHEALMRLLPRLCAGEADAWTTKQRRVILSTLAAPVSYFEFSLTMLRALEQIGGEWAIPAVTKCANLEAHVTFWTKQSGMSRETQLDKITQIKQAAQECLPFLEQRQQEAKQAQTLLRASAPVAPTDTLLRPAAPAVQENGGGEQLLRPVGTTDPSL